ncbi:FRG domain-containing protein [Kribbella sp. NBC_00382]|uniref:FRG domain-containing protein n=1 Tax=Kribbella sp. NBC_00382 TaxID=2975967 RepID=UPI002E21D207
MMHHTPNVAEAQQLAERMKASGECNWFRGQTRNWPVLSSLSRRDEAQHAEACDRMAAFDHWVDRNPDVRSMIRTRDDRIAVAQHYALPTNFVDFTTEPAVAAFFACHEPPLEWSSSDLSCIICVNTDDLRDVWETVRNAGVEIPPFEEIRVDVPELWRLQAQRGIFLYFPFDEGFERHVYDFDRICFPSPQPPAGCSVSIPEEDIYPTQQSQLEISLDQFFMLERLTEGHQAFEQMLSDGRLRKITKPSLPDGLDPDVFGPLGLPEHESWSPAALSGWSTPAPEAFVPISTAPELEVFVQADAMPNERRLRLAESLTQQIAGTTGCRAGPVRWHLSGEDFKEGSGRVSEAMSLTWDGLRRLPFGDDDLAHALAMAATFALAVHDDPQARSDPELAGRLAAVCLGASSVFETEIGMLDGSYTRGWAAADELAAAVRDDFPSFLNAEFRSRIDSIWTILQVSTVPRRTFVFERLATVFARQIVPTQIVARGPATGKARLYNPVQAMSLGRP